MDRYALQDAQYAFPYHYLPHFGPNGSVAVSRALGWGLEYLTYMTWVRDQVLQRRPHRMLDAGCGDGRLLHLLEGHVEERVGVDPSPRAIAFAKAFNPRCRLLVGTAADLNDEYDLVTCVEVLEHIADESLPDFVSSLAERTRRGGILIVTVPSVARPLHPKHFRHYSVESLRSQLGSSFVMEQVYGLFKLGPFTAALSRTLVNRMFSVNAASIRKAIWRMHRKRGFFGSPRNSAHLGALFRKV